MPKRFYKHKTLLDEHLYHRRVYPLLNAHFDVKHIRDDLHLDGLPDPQVYKITPYGRTLALDRHIPTVAIGGAFTHLLTQELRGVQGI